VKKRIAIIGASDLGRQLAHHLSSDGTAEVVGFFDDFAPFECVLGKTSDVLSSYQEGKFDSVLIGVGYKAMAFRSRMLAELQGHVPLHTLRSQSSIVDDSATIGEGSVLLYGTIVDQDVVIRENCFLSLGCSVSHESVVGVNTYCGPRVTVCGRCRIGANCFIGAGTIIRDGIKIADDVTVGAGTVVVRDICQAGVYIGCPARKLR